MNVQIPRQGVFKNVERTFLKGGLFDGALGLHLSVGPDTDVGASIGDAFGALMKNLLEVQLPRSLPLVRLSGPLERVEPESLTAVLRALAHYGRAIQVVLNEPGAWPEWLGLASWTIVRTSTPFVLVPANEIWYRPDATKEGPIEDIQFPPGPRPERQFFYLDRTLSVDRTEEFFMTSAFSWALL